MSACVEIVRIGPESLEEAFLLLQRFFGEEGFDTPAGEMRSSLWTVLASESNALFLARRGGEALGIATVALSVGIEYGLAAELEDLYVLPGARRSGVASALIETACRWCREQGCSAVLVTVTPQGEARHGLSAFYRHHGFSNQGRVILERDLRRPAGRL